MPTTPANTIEVDPGLRALGNQTFTGSEPYRRPVDQSPWALQHPLPEDNTILDRGFIGSLPIDGSHSNLSVVPGLDTEYDLWPSPSFPPGWDHAGMPSTDPLPEDDTIRDELFDGFLSVDESHSNLPKIPGLDTVDCNSTLDDIPAPAVLEHPLSKDMTITDSGYDSGFPTYPKTRCEQGFVKDDCASIVSDGYSSALPSSDKRVLEGQFARELFNSISVKAREKVCTSRDTVTDLLQCFAVMISKQARSITEKGAASFVRHGRR